MLWLSMDNMNTKNTIQHLISYIVCVCVSCIVVNTTGCAQRSHLLVKDSFEGMNARGAWQRVEAGKTTAIRRSDSVARNGRYSMRVELNKNDPMAGGSKRAEMVFTSEKTPNVERWYKFSIFLPKDYSIDPVHEILAQWHEIPDRDLGEDWRTPPISLQIARGVWQASIKWATAQLNTNKTISGKIDTSLGNIEMGVWTDWIFHIRFSYTNTGLLQIWKNGKQVLNYYGPNYFYV